MIGFIGLGAMGMPMARNLLRKTGSLVAFNRSEEKIRAIAREGALAAGSAAEAAEKADVLFLSLPGPAQAEEVAKELFVHGRPGQVILDLSTVSPGLSRELAALGETKGVRYIDVPVSGGTAGAAAGTLSLMVGAAEEEFASLGVKEYTDAIGDKYFFMGRRGNGNAIKLINNYMAFAALAVDGEALALADALGIAPEDFFAVTTQSSGGNRMLSAKRYKVLAGDYTPGFAVDLVVKDLTLAAELCRDAKVPNRTLDTALEFYRAAQARGRGGEDASAVVQTIREGE